MTILAVIIVIALFVAIFIKMSNIKESVDDLSRNDLYEIKKMVRELNEKAATRKDAKDIWDAIQDLSAKGVTTVVTGTPPQEEPKAEPAVTETMVAEAPVMHEEEITPPVMEEIIPEETVPEAAEIAAEVTKVPQPVAEEVAEQEETIETEAESAPAYAAFSNTQATERPFARMLGQTTPQPSGNSYDDRSFVEKLLSANTLSKIGIVTFVLGIAFFVKYAIDQDWINEIGRVGIGILTGAIIIGIAHKLKSKYHLFSSILVGGGISVLYITVTLAFQEYELFGQTPAFIMLIAITIFSVVLSLLYDRKELAIFSLLGGFASPLMVTTGAGNYIVLFSYILILNTGMLVLAFRKGWKVIGMIAYPLTLIFYAVWLLSGFKDEYRGAALFASLFFVQFYLLALIEHAREGSKITAFQAIIILSNNLLYYLALIYIFDDMYQIRGIITIGLAIINAVVLGIMYRRSNIDRNLLYMLIGVVMTFVSLAIPVQMNGHVITMFWAAETVILLWLWQKSRIQVFLAGFGIICGLVVVSYMMDIPHHYSLYADNPVNIIFNRIFVTGIVVLAACLINIFLLRKENDNSGSNISRISTALKYAALLLIYLIPFMELYYQLEFRVETEIYSSLFTPLAMATYTIVFIAILNVVFWKRSFHPKAVYGLLLAAAAGYTLLYPYFTTELRFDIYGSAEPDYSPAYFMVHLLSLPAIAVITTYLAQRARKLFPDKFTTLCWVLCILSFVTLSFEADHVAIMLFGRNGTYDHVLYDMHTFGYPILWGLMALILMVWGLKSKEVVLRKISLIAFGIIIVKFYALDIWQMSVAGRIISFVVLGAILLTVSFLQQKIKVLMKDDSEADENDNQE